MTKSNLVGTLKNSKNLRTVETDTVHKNVHLGQEGVRVVIEVVSVDITAVVKNIVGKNDFLQV